MMSTAAQHPMKRALVVGGVASFIQETASKKLARWGFIVSDHQEMGKKGAPRVAGVDAVIVFYDMVAHRSDVDAWKAAAGRAGVPCLLLPRKESQWSREMQVHGFEPINPNTAAAVAVATEEEEMAQEGQKQSGKVMTLEARLSPVAAFMERKEALRRLLREMVEKDGLKEVIFSPDSGLSLKRVAIEEFNEEV